MPLHAPVRRDPRITALVALAIAALLGVLIELVSQVNRLYPGFFFAPDYRVFPVSPESCTAGLVSGDRIAAVDGQSPLALMARVDASAAGPLRYEVERGARRFAVDLPARTFTWSDLIQHFAGYFAVSAIMLAVGLLVFAQNPAATPNRNLLIYMCLWAVSNAAVPEAVLGTKKYAAILVSFIPPLLSVHGWVFFLTYPANPVRQAWLVGSRRGGPMRITAVRPSWLRAQIPADRAHVSGFGRNDTLNTCLVEIETDAGLVGLGEAKAGVGNLGNYAALVALIREEIAPALIGRDPRDISALWERLLVDGHVLAPTLPGLGLTLRRDFARRITVAV